ncbi:MAG: peptidoglycan DD-metalloendopeptidase family protein [Desulfobacterales bacterium]|nr:peptidoglycan DD-metalloendopeptidase family protein [Desulfobacterales bacterium]MCP4161011.1 peptidoglycan DD-metalloendopeptidase family protein [Deltaproteobacteria bacterium]
MFFIKKNLKIRINLFIIVTILLLFMDNLYAGDPYGLVLVKALRVRAKANVNSPHKFMLKKGSRFTIDGYQGSWLEISYKGMKGYLHSDERYVKIFDKTTTGRLRNARERAKTIDNKIQNNLKLIKEYKNKEKGLVNLLSDIDQSLNRNRLKIATLKKKLRKTNRQIRLIEGKEKKLLSEIQKIEVYISKRIIAFYKLKRAGTMNFLASADSVYDFMIREKAILRFVKSDLALFNKRNKDMLKLLNLQNNLANKNQRIGALKQEYESKQDSFNIERRERSKFLSVIRSRKSSRIEAIKALEKASLALDDKISSISIDIYKKKKSPKKSNFGFSKGTLEMPVKGRIISFYGANRSSKYNIVTFKSGIKIKAQRGDPVQAVFGGEIMFASWFKGYGNMMIINHGNHYYTLYAHMEELFKSKGEKIEKGDVIATVGDTGSISGSGLHFEIRHHGKPIDPIKWLKNG